MTTRKKLASKPLTVRVNETPFPSRSIALSNFEVALIVDSLVRASEEYVLRDSATKKRRAELEDIAERLSVAAGWPQF